MSTPNSQYRLNDITKLLNRLGVNRLDVLLTGVTGAGKSTTLNALLDNQSAKIGHGVDPETMFIKDYKLNDKVYLWDSPGFGDNVNKDKEHSKKLIEILHKNYGKAHYQWIDTVFVIIEGTKRDMGTTTRLINLIVENFPKDKILVAINQADIAMSGRHWIAEMNCPDEILKQYLDDFSNSIQQRVKRDTKIDIKKPVYYSAHYGYNINIFMDFLVNNIPQNLNKLR